MQQFGLYPPSDALGVNGSVCGLGEYGPEPGTTSIVGIPLVIDQTYVRDVETRFKDMAAFGELTWHLSSDWSLTGGNPFVQQTCLSRNNGLLFDGPLFMSNNSGSNVWKKSIVEVSIRLINSDKPILCMRRGRRVPARGVNALPLQQPVPPCEPGNCLPAGQSDAGITAPILRS